MRASRNTKLKVGVKFCGHCAPRRDMKEVLAEMKKRAPGIQFVYYVQDNDVDVLLILHACHVECAERPDFTGPVVEASPERVDHWPVEEELLVTTILKKLQGNNGTSPEAAVGGIRNE